MVAEPTPGRCPVCRGPMPPRKRTGRPAKSCSDRCRKTAERQRRAGERLEAQHEAHRAYLAQLAAERRRAALALVEIISADPGGAAAAIEEGCRSFATYELERLGHEIAAGGRAAIFQQRQAG